MNAAPQKRFRVRWPDVWGLAGLSIFALIITAALFYGWR